MDPVYLVLESMCHADARINFPYIFPIQTFLEFLGRQDQNLPSLTYFA